ncbi:MFS transporter [Streptomyces sp. NPDC055210]
MSSKGRSDSRSLFSLVEFRAAWLAESVSYFGDQLARVALAILVFDRTKSAALTGITYALTYVPSVIGALTLSQFADKRSRRGVIMVMDGSRAAVVAAMTIPGVPLPYLCLLVSVMSFLGGPYKAAQLALLREILTSEQYPVGMSIRQVTTQAAQIGGFAFGGLISSTLTPQVCLAVNSFTFAASFTIYLFFVGPRPAPGPRQGQEPDSMETMALWEEPGRRAIFLTTFLGFFYVAPEAVAAPYVSALGYEKIWVGILLASTGVGAVLGLWVFLKLVPVGSYVVCFPAFCFTAGIPLIAVSVPGAGILVASISFALSNALWCIQVVISVSMLAELLPDNRRARGMGVASAMNLTSQGFGTGCAGILTQLFSPAFTLAAMGIASMLVSMWPALLWRRTQTKQNHLSEKV